MSYSPKVRHKSQLTRGVNLHACRFNLHEVVNVCMCLKKLENLNRG